MAFTKEAERANDACVQQQERSYWKKTKNNCMSPWYKKISVEPTIFLYVFAIMVTSVVEKDFFMQKACRVNNNFSDEICTNIKADENAYYKKQVQITTAKFLQIDAILAPVFPIILAFFFGSFSDRRGRKFPLLLGLTGKLIHGVMMTVNARMKTWPLEYVIYTATLPSALMGADVAVVSSCLAYIADISTLKNRTLRVIIFEVFLVGAMPTGVALGSYLFYNVFNESYAYMFTVNAACLALANVYSFFVLKWQTTPKQRSLRELGCCGFFVDFFDCEHVKDFFRVLAKPRPGHRRTFLILLLIAMCLYKFEVDENQYLFLYTTFKFNWNVHVYSTFKTFVSSAQVVGMLLAGPLMNTSFHWKDTTIIFIGALAYTITCLFYYFAETATLFYVGAAFGSLGPVVGAMIRTMTSKIVPQSERGKVFALLSVCAQAVPFLSGICYSQVYRATLNDEGKGGGGVFLLTMATQLAIFVLILSIHLLLGDQSLAVAEVTENESQFIHGAAANNEPIKAVNPPTASVNNGGPVVAPEYAQAPVNNMTDVNKNSDR